ncbi:MAG: hypothetical protein NTW87_27500 [Planctomycetota bacterium]|nr:hypothetical protein [Planctomycetota bacterium]
MKQPEFTLWPWKVSALAVPAMALVAVLLALSQSADKREAMVVFFGVLAAGNAYLFAMAVGDFGRSVIAIPVGAVAGVVAVEVFKHQEANVVYLLFLGILVITGMVRGFVRALPGCGLLILVFIAFMIAAAAGGLRGGDVTLCVLSAYPFVCGAVTATMPLDSDLPGIWNACMAGTRAALHGLLMGAFIGIFSLPVCFVLYAGGLLLQWRSPVAASAAFNVAPLVALLATNYFCVKYVFAAVHRAEAPSVRPPAEPLEGVPGPEAPAAPAKSLSQPVGRYGLPPAMVPPPKIELAEDTPPEEQQEKEN